LSLGWTSGANVRLERFCLAGSSGTGGAVLMAARFLANTVLFDSEVNELNVIA
jgi:hypothetical protein